MTDDEIRSQFRTFAGEEHFRAIIFKTVNALGTDYIAPYDYQLRLSFREKCTAAPIELLEIQKLLLWCHVHERPLVANQLAHPMFDRHTLNTITHSHRTSEWYNASEKGFPHGHGGLDVICPECVAAHLEWLAANPNCLTASSNRR